MLFSVVLAALFGATATTATQYRWLVHVDYSACKDKEHVEVKVDGIPTADTVTPDVTMFGITKTPYDGYVVLTWSGSVGWGLPEPEKIQLEIFDKAQSDGAWAKAKYIKGLAGANGLAPLQKFNFASTGLPASSPITINNGVASPPEITQWDRDGGVLYAVACGQDQQ